MRDEATQRQVDAAAPDASTWLAANAGSGKTRVLTDRVARLLLEGVDPSHILCLTYTKAAATEMQNRLFKRLGAWAMLPEPDLRDELAALGVETAPSHAFLQEARTLFARAIETPGGLRIQTIHSFCASLLRRFPLEARVSPQFQEMEDRAAELLRAEILDQIASGPDRGLLEGIAPWVSGDDPGKLLAALSARRDVFVDPPAPDAIRAAYGLKPDDGEDSLLASVFLGNETDLAAALVPHFKAGGKTEQGLVPLLQSIRGRDTRTLGTLKQICLTQAGTIRKNFPTKATRKNAPELCEAYDQLAARVEGALETEKALIAADRDIALTAFAARFVPAYEEAKMRRGWLDFDDLITRARDLLSDERVADWVLYRLDGGIDHILVDEAQDTSPVQWDVIERLAREFTSGEGARETRRTIFVVGDKKQSIYSFQGADPSEFDRMREHFRERLMNTDAPLNAMVLEYSFRSADPILRVVDKTFEGADASGFSADQKHRAFKSGMPGRVDLWPVVDKTRDDEDGPWHQPLDRKGARHHTVILAQRIARFIRRTIDAGTPLPEENGHSGTYHARPVHAGDFLILVRRRSQLFKEIIRACKQEDLPIAGADRLKVMAELAVRDIIALLSFLETPEDSLSLATALRSPLFGLSEQDLFTLAHRRTTKYLWPTLRDSEAHPAVLAVLNDLRGQTDFLRPYDLIERILTRHKGRRLLIGRLGQEAEDGINALLQQALAYEQTAVPTLTGFLQWAQSDDLQIKRAPDSAGETLRVMTVHGAKGLEAPIVILPDCAAPDASIKAELLSDPDGVIWKQTSDAQPPRQQAAVEAAKVKEAQERDRLLYVALTRAEKWLIVAAAGDGTDKPEAWYDKVRLGMIGSGAMPSAFEFGDLGSGEGLTLGTDWSGLEMRDPHPLTRQTVEMPAHLLRPISPPEELPKTRSPSDLGGAKALGGAEGDTEEVATARGTALHGFLEVLAPLPEKDRRHAGDSLLQQYASDTETVLIHEQLPQILDEALRVLENADFADFFGPDSLAEVPITADLGPLGRIHGIIDRLLVGHSRVVAIDYKTNRTTPATPEETPDGLLRQVAVYHAALAQLYPDREIETGLLWTATNHYMPIPHELVTQALARATAS
ncbi:double-strand break repair helicase AddA [Sagittula stellata]|uniref:DNA 3'-5' helicase n=1 Tax=Sagittula stellata (strain ATCC 700073 / DSM 11524 / E-37) TaxID=388399 RepID=A3KAY7_SAGS3|nr:double-strand break repair helicase AddA [Sagittula stellata]EBA05656.1 ATP-dependent DNA helicase, UvrD/Rep family protein [Sagittula stellata E-37]